ncbi:MAG: DUF3592 domain-containing protein [Crinalium sp.]
MNINISILTKASIAIIVGIGLILFSLFGFKYTIQFIRRASSAKGIIIDLRREIDKDSEVSYYPVFKYETQQEIIIQKTSGIGTNRTPYYIGQKVNVLYNPNNPNEAAINSFLDLWLTPIVSGFFGILLVVIGLANLN